MIGINWIHFTDRGIRMKSKNMTLKLGDCKRLLGHLQTNSIDLVLTSPPYDNLRTYNNQQPFTFDDFKIVAQQLKRVLRPGGVIVWVVGDAVINGSETGTSFRQALYFKKIGLNIHDTMIYEKTGFSFPMHTRYHQIFEYMFIISNGRPKTFRPIKDRINRWAGNEIKGTCRSKNGEIKRKYSHGKGFYIKKFGMRTNIWRFATGYFNTTLDKIAYKHPAIFPDKLAHDHVISWSNKGDIVLDPFMGSGTVGKACKQLSRKFIGIELDSRYFIIAKTRINQI